MKWKSVVDLLLGLYLKEKKMSKNKNNSAKKKKRKKVGKRFTYYTTIDQCHWRKKNKNKKK